MKRLLLVVIVLSALLAGTGVSTNAATNASVGFTGGGAGTPSQEYSITAVPNADDGGGIDYVCVVAYNGNGEIYDIDVNYLPTGNSAITVTNWADSVGIGAYVEPLSVKITDPNTPYSGNENTAAGAAWCASFPAPGGGEGCDNYIPLTSTSVVGAFVSETKLYWGPSPDKPTTSDVASIPAGKTAWVLGVDKSGEFYEIVWQCQQLWVPVASMGPNYDDTWHGWPLPTTVVQ